MTVTLRAKAVEVQAVLWTGENREEIEDFIGYTPHVRFDNTNGEHLKIWNFLEDQWVNVPFGHYLIRGLEGEYYPFEQNACMRKYEIAGEYPNNHRGDMHHLFEPIVGRIRYWGDEESLDHDKLRDAIADLYDALKKEVYKDEIN